MLLAVNLNFLLFSVSLDDMMGQVCRVSGFECFLFRLEVLFPARTEPPHLSFELINCSELPPF